MKNSLFFLLLLCLSACMEQRIAETPPYFLPAEWEPHEAVWLSYYGMAADTVLDKLVAGLEPGSGIVCVVDGDSISRVVKARWDSLGIGRDARFLVMPDTLSSPVVRDAGPIFLRADTGGLAILDGEWNYYGDHESKSGIPAHIINGQKEFPRMIADQLGLPVVRTAMVVEGGGLEANGKGTLLQVEAVTMQRNPGWSRDSLEKELKRVFGVQDIIWLKEGPADDMWYLEPRIHGRVFNQGTGGHVDEFCRFVNENTVLLSWPEDEELGDSVQVVTRSRMEENLRILERSGIQVVKVPVPFVEEYKHMLDTLRSYDRMLLELYEDLHHGDTIRYIPAASYLNYLVTNGRVFVPAYWREGMPDAMRVKDMRFQEIMKKWHPDRMIVPIDPRAINWQGGGMHCWTMQQPK